ncbi:MAG: ROK family protein [Patescibacteria group bacterium]|nr:ROK family protein [Patescibacteria group bacterium]
MKKDLVIAVDLGASNLRIALVSKKGKILKSLIAKTPKKGTSGIVISKKIILLINAIISNQSKKQILGIGIGSAGPLDYKSGKIFNSSNIPFKNIPLVEPLKKYFNLPVYLFNDCSAATWGEKTFGAGKKYKNLVYVSISSGIGSGAIVDNHFLIGHNHNATEVGHFIVDTKYSLLCSCKRGHGHWEGYCSGNNLVRFLKYWIKSNNIKKKHSIKAAEDIFVLAKQKDKTILKFIEEVGRINARGISNVIVAYSPEMITLGGAVILNNKKFILPYIKKNIDKFLIPPKIIITPLKENIVLLGVAALVFSK